jgi:DNA invertase Pin-like site-specific DNA recombinase
MNLPNQEKPKRAVIYVRVSTKEQVDEGNSLATQERICREYAQKNNIEIAEIFIEQGESAKTADRTELQKLFRYCANKKNQITAVIIYKLDRLSRNTDDYSQIRLLLKRYEVEIKSTSEYFENTPVGRFMENTMANIAQFDNDIRAERSTNGMKDAVKDGRYVWMAPVGYDNVKIGGRATIAQNIDKAPLVLRTFELVASNVYPTEEVRKIMTKEGLSGRLGKPLTKGYFYTLLRNELYAGWIYKFGEKQKGLFTPIVPEELFDQVQRVLRQKGHKHSVHVTDHPDFPLRRFVTNESGKKLTGSWSKGRDKKYPYYRFGGNDSNYSRDKFEENFMQFLDSYSFDDEKITKLKQLIKKNFVKSTFAEKKETERLQKYIQDLKIKQSSMIQKNLDGIIPDSVLKTELALIDKDLCDANAIMFNRPESKIDYLQVPGFLEEFLKKPSKIWHEAPIDTKVKLQWFQFPQGLKFENKKFGTGEVCLFYKAKDTILTSKSSNVDSEYHFWNQFAKEITDLKNILENYNLKGRVL